MLNLRYVQSESMVRILTLLCITFSIFNGICQTEAPPQKFKNQLSTNLLLPFLGSVDLSYERTVANKWAVGVGGALYGNGFENLSTSDYSYDQETKYEITPFVRLYFNGAQEKSHFLEVFGSLSEVEEWGRYIRHVTKKVTEFIPSVLELLSWADWAWDTGIGFCF